MVARAGLKYQKWFEAVKPVFFCLVEAHDDGQGPTEQRLVEERRLVDLNRRGGGRFGSVRRHAIRHTSPKPVAGSIVGPVRPPPPKGLAPKLHMAPYGWGPEPPVAHVAGGQIHAPDHKF